jgi:hypothetical protein
MIDNDTKRFIGGLLLIAVPMALFIGGVIWMIKFSEEITERECSIDCGSHFGILVRAYDGYTRECICDVDGIHRNIW